MSNQENLLDHLAAKNMANTHHTLSPNIWELTENRYRFFRDCAKRNPNVEIALVSGQSEKKTYMLHHLLTDEYISLSEQDHFIWLLLDGKNTVKDLSLKYIDRFNTIGHENIIHFLNLLKKNGFILGHEAHIYQIIKERINNQHISRKIFQACQFFIHSTHTTKKADQYFTGLYRMFGRILFSRPAKLICGILIACCVMLTIYYKFFQHTSLLISQEGVAMHDLLSFMYLTYASFFVHENMHGLTVKHYGRKVLQGGVILYMGSPFAYVETTDIWMKPRYARMNVSFAGPAANGVLGGGFLLAALLLPPGLHQRLCLHVGLLNSLLFMANLVPFAETDGHYIIQDYLEKPHLRPNSLRFVTWGMWGKIFRFQSWKPLDFIHLFYGLIALAGYFFMLFLAWRLWLSTGQLIFRHLIDNPHHIGFKSFLLVLMAIIAAVIIYRVQIFRAKINVNKILRKKLPKPAEKGDKTCTNLS